MLHVWLGDQSSVVRQRNRTQFNVTSARLKRCRQSLPRFARPCWPDQLINYVGFCFGKSYPHANHLAAPEQFLNKFWVQRQCNFSFVIGNKHMNVRFVRRYD